MKYMYNCAECKLQDKTRLTSHISQYCFELNTHITFNISRAPCPRQTINGKIIIVLG